MSDNNSPRIPTHHRRNQSDFAVGALTRPSSGRKSSAPSSATVNASSGVAISGSERSPSISWTQLQESWTTSDNFLSSWTNLSGNNNGNNNGNNSGNSYATSNQFLGSSSWSSNLSNSMIPSSAGVSNASKSAVETISSAIHDAARITDWPTVRALCTTQPAAAAFVGKDGWTALHHACNRRCPDAEAVRLLIQAFPDATRLGESKKNWRPLHFACRFKAPLAAVKLLLEECPDAAGARDSLGRTPLWYALRYDAPSGVVPALLEADPSVVLNDEHPEASPLVLVWNDWAEKRHGKRIVSQFLPAATPANTSVETRAVELQERLESQEDGDCEELRERWDLVQLLLKAGWWGQEDDGSKKFRIVHATAAVPCHFAMFRLACALHPEQVLERDEATGYTALHWAAASKADGDLGKMVLVSLLSLAKEAVEMASSNDGSLPLHLLVENPHKADWRQHGAILHEFYPRAVQVPDHQGRLPLHRAAAAATCNSNASVSSNNSDENGDNDARPVAAREEQQRPQEIDETEVTHHEEADESSIIAQLVRSYPEAALTSDDDGFLPLHHACATGRHVPECLCPRGAIQTRTRAGELALHLAACNIQIPAASLKFVLHQDPRAITLPHGPYLPFGLACRAGQSWRNGRILLEAHPAGVHDGQPLLWACSVETPNNKNDDLIVALAQQYPTLAAMEEREQYPLHAACGALKEWSTLQVLIQQYPLAVVTADADGCVPFHRLALANDQDDDDDAADLGRLYQMLRTDPTVLLA